MKTPALPEEIPLGLMELDLRGNVLYYNRDSRDEPPGLVPEMVGRNFFAEVAPAAHADELRRLVQLFLLSRETARSHHLRLTRGGQDTPVHVLLARLHTHTPARQTDESVLLHIKEDRPE